MSGNESDSSLDEGGAPLANYEVLSAGQGAKGEALYTVKRAGTAENAPTFVWRATKWSGESIEPLCAEIKHLKPLESLHLKIPQRPRFHEASGTLYTVTTHTVHPSISQLRQQCNDGGFGFRENFIWSVLHQVAAVCDRLRSIKLLHWVKRFDSTRIYINPEGEVTVDPFVPRSTNSQKECFNDICKFGKALYEMCTLTEYSEDSNVSLECSDEFKKMINDLLHCNGSSSKCKIGCDVILYHPTVLCHLDRSKNMFTETLQLEVSTPTNDSAFESDESNISKLSIPTIKSNVTNSSIVTVHSKARRSISEPDLSPNLLALDLNLPGYVPRKISGDVEKWRSRLNLCKEPHEVSEDALNKVWLDRLKTLRERELAVEVKEKEMKKQKLFDEIRSKIAYEDHSTPLHVNINQSIQNVTPGITLQTVMNEKVLPQADKINSEPCFECKSIESIKPKPRTHRYNSKGRCRKKISMHYEDMDSSLSADPGDGSIIFTSSKLSAELLPRPSSICSMARKKVHFTSRNNPFAEYDDISHNIFTFYDNESNNQSYEVPIKLPQKPESIADRINKFTYLDLEAMTKKKREKMEEMRKLQSDLSNVRNVQKPELNLNGPQAFTVKRKTRRSKYFSPGLDSQSNIYSESSGASVSSYQPSKKVRDNRKSMPFLSINGKSNTPKKVLPNELSVNNGRVTRSKSIFGLNVTNTPKFSLPAKKEDSMDCNKKGKSNKENSPSPKLKRDSKRKSILGFKTPFKFHF